MKISELLGVLNTKNEDGHDVQTRDDDEDLVLDGSHAPSKESESKRDLENPARRTPLPIAKKQLTSTFIHNSDLASKVIVMITTYCHFDDNLVIFVRAHRD